MGWTEAVVEVLCILQAMPGWMSGMVLAVAFVLAVGYLVGKLRER